MKLFTFSYPTKVYFGEGSAEQAFDAELGKVGETVMLAYGGGSVKKNGVYDEMKALLERAGKKVVDFSGIMPNRAFDTFSSTHMSLSQYRLYFFVKFEITSSTLRIVVL